MGVCHWTWYGDRCQDRYPSEDGWHKGGLLYDRPPILCKDRGYRENFFVQNASAQCNHWCLHAVSTCLSAMDLHRRGMWDAKKRLQ